MMLLRACRSAKKHEGVEAWKMEWMQAARQSRRSSSLAASSAVHITKHDASVPFRQHLTALMCSLRSCVHACPVCMYIN